MAHTDEPFHSQSRPHELKRKAAADAQFVLPLGDLLKTGAKPRYFVGDGALADMQVIETSISPTEPIHVEAKIESVHEGVLVTGTAKTRWQGTCRRCLEPATAEMEVAFRELCVDGGDEETTYPLFAEELELDPIVHDACILNLPLAPLCREDCLGICVQCGTNRNLESCSCAAGLDPRWSGLAELNGGRDDPSKN